MLVTVIPLTAASAHALGGNGTETNPYKISTYDELYEAISGKFEAGDTVPAKCAHLEKSGISYYDIEFKLMEDTSGNY